MWFAIEKKPDINELLSNPQLEKKVVSSNKVAKSKKLKDIAKSIPKLSKQRKRKLQTSGEPVPGIDSIKTVPNRFPFESKWDQKKKVVDPSIQAAMP